MSDLIDRQAALDALARIFDQCEEIEAHLPKGDPDITGYKMYPDYMIVWEYLHQLPSADQDRWIPCSERLPEYMEPVLTWDGGAYCVEKRIPIIRDSDTGEEIPGDWWVSDDYDEYESDYYPNLRDGACIAWMPLPEPYREAVDD